MHAEIRQLSILLLNMQHFHSQISFLEHTVRHSARSRQHYVPLLLGKFPVRSLMRPCYGPSEGLVLKI